MSYTKVLKIIIEVYASAKLEYPQNRKVSIWLKDANVPYLQSKHLVLTVVTSLVLVFLFLPYTLLLLLGHKLYHLSGKKYLRWLNRLKPLLDSYYAPYKINTRYWTGFLLLVRCALYIVFSFNSLGGTHRSFLAINITFTALVLIVGVLHQGKIYKNFPVNILETYIYLNLVTLSSITAHASYVAALSYFLIGTVFAATLGVIAVHFHVAYFSKSAAFLKMKAKILNLRNPKVSEENSLQGISSHDPLCTCSCLKNSRGTERTFARRALGLHNYV